MPIYEYFIINLMNSSLRSTETLQEKNCIVTQQQDLAQKIDSTAVTLNSERAFLHQCSPKKIKFKFISKLLDMLSCPEIDKTISWSKEGNSFVIKDIRIFIEEILPRFYKHNSMSNFIRQLNMYHFKKVKQATPYPKGLTYYNPLFIKDDYNHISMIDRKMSKPLEQIESGNPKMHNPSENLYKLDSNQEKYSDSTPKDSVNLLKKKLRSLKATQHALQKESCNSLEKIEENDQYMSKLEAILLYLATLLKKNLRTNQTIQSFECQSKISFIQEHESAAANCLILNCLEQSNKINGKLSQELCMTLKRVISKYNHNLLDDHLINDNLDLKFSHSDNNWAAPEEPSNDKSDVAMNLLELNEFSKFAFNNQLSSQCSFKSTNSKFDFFRNDSTSQSFAGGKLESSSFTSADHFAMTKEGLNDQYFERDLS